jgi:hypothetical protein
MRKNLQKVTLNLYHGDLDRLRDLYPRMEKGVALRELLHEHLRHINSRVPSVVIEPNPRVKEIVDDLDPRG